MLGLLGELWFRVTGRVIAKIRVTGRVSIRIWITGRVNVRIVDTMSVGITQSNIVEVTRGVVLGLHRVLGYGLLEC